MILPPPPKWDERIDGLEDAFRWAADYERSLLPSDILFPRAGQTWKAVRDCEVDFIAFITKTILLGGRARLEEGEQVRTGIGWGTVPEAAGSVVRDRHEFRQTPLGRLSIPALRRLLSLDFQDDRAYLIP